MIRERTSDRFARVVNILSRLFYMFFWFFDNIQILFKMIKPNNLETRYFVQTLSRRFQLIGQLLFLIYCVKTLRRTYTDESDMKVAALNKMTVKAFQENLALIERLRMDYLLNLIRASCDFAVCLNENNIP